jgi:hypothetical protein
VTVTNNKVSIVLVPGLSNRLI